MSDSVVMVDLVELQCHQRPHCRLLGTPASSCVPAALTAASNQHHMIAAIRTGASNIVRNVTNNVLN